MLINSGIQILNEFVFELIVGFILLIIGYLFRKKFLHKKNIIETLEKYGELQNKGKSIYKYTHNNKVYHLFIWKVKKNATISFNSKKIWAVSLGNKIIRKDFSFFTQLEGEKLVVIYPNNEKPKYYLNESEVDYVDPFTPLWKDTKIVKFKELEEFLKIDINEKEEQTNSGIIT